MPLARASLSARSTIYPRSDALARSTRIYEESDNEVDRMRDGDAKPNSDKKGSALAGRTVGKILHMTVDDLDRQQAEAGQLPRWIIHPGSRRYFIWWWVTICAVAFTVWYEPYVMAFAQYPGLEPPWGLQAWAEYLMIAIFATDMLVTFHVAYYDNEVLVDDPAMIRANYLRSMFFVDLLTTIPFENVVLGIAGLNTRDDATARYIGLLRLLQLGRVYRIRELFTYLEYNMNVSMLAVTLVRNFTFVSCWVHVAACILYFMARQGNFDERHTWIGANIDIFSDKSTLERYVYSLYWGIVTFATVGFGDLHAQGVAEALFFIVYITINLALYAYILGTITQLVVKSDYTIGTIREKMHALDSYAQVHGVPVPMKHAMQDHLKLHLSSKEASDEEVLAIYPSAIRRQILRHLYLDLLQRSSLFQGCKDTFLDTLLSSAHMDMFMPGVDLVKRGDHVAELFIVVRGVVKVEQHKIALLESEQRSGTASPRAVARQPSFPPPAAPATASAGGSTDMAELVAAEAGQAGAAPPQVVTMCGVGDAVGELSFFTGLRSPVSATSEQLCRVLVISKAAYTAIEQSFPTSARKLLENLQRRLQRRLQRDMRSMNMSISAATELLAERRSSSLANSLFSDDGELSRQHTMEGAVAEHPAAPLTSRQRQVVANLLGIQRVLQQQIEHLAAQRTSDLLSAAARDDVLRVRTLLDQGMPADARDYDGRTALHVACAKGTVAVIELLLAAGAGSSVKDAMGATPMLDAARFGQEAAMEVLLRHGATLGLEEGKVSQLLCECVHRGDVVLLSRLLRAGADANAQDYDRRSALHVAAADGNLAVVKLLVEQGGARVQATDRWGSTALEDARHSQAQQVVAFLEGCSSGAGPQTAQRRQLSRQLSRQTGDLALAERRSTQDTAGPARQDMQAQVLQAASQLQALGAKLQQLASSSLVGNSSAAVIGDAAADLAAASAALAAQAGGTLSSASASAGEAQTGSTGGSGSTGGTGARAAASSEGTTVSAGAGPSEA